MTRRNTFLLVASVGLLAACAMHNRMFYLHRYAGEARRLEQEGRRFEANDYWGRASVKAESVLVHRSAGDDAAEAMAIRGEAMAALGQCEEALRVLGDAMVQLRDSTEAEYAALAQARCYVQNGFPQLAAQSVQPVIESFPVEVRALCIALFFALGTGIGGIGAPWLFGVLIGSGEPAAIAWGYVLGSVLMVAAAAAALALGVAAERKPLERVAVPLSCIDASD